MTRRVMLVAGGTGSIGGAIAAHAIAAGWRVAVHGRSEMSTAATIERLAVPHDDAVRGLPIDITQGGAAERLIGQASAWGDRLDAVIDCVSAGPAMRIAGALAQTEPEGYDPHLALSLGHLQRLAFAAVPVLARQGGTLVAFASDAGRYAAANQSLIGASRAGIVGFVRNLAMEVARDAVRVHCVSPGFVDGTQSAARLELGSAERMARARDRAGLGLPTPADIAPLVLFLCGDGARRITGQVISVNGGVNA
jgi:NAD(P)-dependent dehydrogenase (short-subunit alcohol dehydrogenase family)